MKATQNKPRQDSGAATMFSSIREKKLFSEG
jgi:hypothetical protein